MEDISRFIKNKQPIPITNLKFLICHVHNVLLATDLLEVDTQLWGSFWYFDVIAPGYLLPASELALLRAMRLDGTWPEGTSIEQFQADLQRAIIQPEAGIWSLEVAGQHCIVFAAPEPSGLITVVWYCLATNKLHAGYRTGVDNLFLPDAIAHRAPTFFEDLTLRATKMTHEWLNDDAYHQNNHPPGSLAAQLDSGIVRIRALTPSTLLHNK